MDFYARKMPYQCIEHMGDALKPTQKLQMYCDIAKHFDCVDTAKLRLLLGIMFSQRGCVSGHYLGEISKEDFEKLMQVKMEASAFEEQPTAPPQPESSSEEQNLPEQE